MRKHLTLLLACIMVIAFTACGSNGNEPATSDADESVAAEVEEEKAVDVEVVESGYSVDEDAYMTYGFVIHNPSEKDAYEYPRVIITAYDSNGDVLATEEQIMNKIQPGETQAFSSIVDCNGEQPDKVEFTAESGDKIKPSDEAIKSSDLEISGTNERNDEWGDTSVTGKVKNNTASDTESVGVIVLFRKEGKIVSGSLTYIDNLSAGQEKPFEISTYNVPEHDAYEVSAIDWGY